MSAQVEVNIIDGLMDMTGRDCQLARRWLLKLLAHYQRPPFRRHASNKKSVAPLVDYIFVCSKFPIGPSELRAKINGALRFYGCQPSDDVNMCSTPYVCVDPHDVQDRAEQQEQEETDQYYKDQCEAQRNTYQTLTQAPWNTRILIFRRQP